MTTISETLMHERYGLHSPTAAPGRDLRERLNVERGSVPN
jgi:hypothetical protein